MRRRARIVQIVSDLIKKPISELRVLDLASLEGHYSFEFAAKGAWVMGIEGRQSNIEKALALGDKLQLTAQFVKDDVRNLSVEKHGTFDVVLCLGILYHLDAPEIQPFLEKIYEVCEEFAVIDTQIALAPDQRVAGRSGYYYTEYQQQPSPEEQEEKTWSSIGNLRSFWPTKPSLVNALADAGFYSVMEVLYPAANDLPADRLTLVALKGNMETPLIEFPDLTILRERLPEAPEVAPILQPASSKRGGSSIGRYLSRLVKSGP